MYLAAEVISVVADYDCYYCRLRPGSQTRGGGGRKDLARYMAIMTERIELLAESRPPGKARDRLMAKHISAVLDGFGVRWLHLPTVDRQRIFDQAAALIERWHTGVIQASLAPPLALRAYCLEHGLAAEMEDIVACRPRTAFCNPIIEGNRVFAGYPHFRDSSGIPDSCFELTDRIRLRQRESRLDVTGHCLTISGEAFLRYIGGSTTIVLRRRPGGPVRRFTPEKVRTPHVRDRDNAYPKAGFTLAVDLDTADDGRPLRPGTWDIEICVGRDGVFRSAPIQPAPGPGLAKPQAGDRVTLRVRRRGPASVDVGEPASPGRLERVTQGAQRLTRA